MPKIQHTMALNQWFIGMDRQTVVERRRFVYAVN